MKFLKSKVSLYIILRNGKGRYIKYIILFKIWNLFVVLKSMFR